MTIKSGLTRAGAPVFVSIFCLASQPALADSNWRRIEKIDPMTDVRMVAIGTPSLASPQCSVTGERAGLHFHCGKKLSVSISAPGCVFESDNVFEYRVDKKKSSYLSAYTYDDRSRLFLSDLAAPDNPAKNLFMEFLRGKDLFIAISPYASSREIINFDLTGMAEQIGTDFDGCVPGASALASRETSGGPSAGATSGETSAGATSEGSSAGGFKRGAGLSATFDKASVEAQIVEQLACEELPSPGPILEALRQQGKIDPEENQGFDSLSCFVIKGGLALDEITFNYVCGFEEDESIRAQYSDLFYRGPGTSPGQQLELFTTSGEDDTRKWFARVVATGGSEDAIGKDRGKTKVECSSWIR